MKNTKRAKNGLSTILPAGTTGKINKVDRIVLKKGMQAQVSLLKLINEYFWRSWTGPFFAFVFPAIYIALLGFLLSYNMTLGGSICMGSIIIGIYALPTSVYDFKKSSLLKRIGVTPVSPLWFIFCICIFYFLIMIISMIWCFLISLAMFSVYWEEGPNVTFNYDLNDVVIGVKTQFMGLADVLKYVDYAGFLFSFVLIILIGTTLGMLIVSVCKTSMQLQSISVLILILTIIIGGQAVPVYIVRSIPALWWLGYVVDPFKPIINMATEAWNGPIPFANADTGLVAGETIEWWDADKGLWDPLFTVHLQNWGGPNLLSDPEQWNPQSTIWNVNVPYTVFCTMMLPNVQPGPTLIVSSGEKIAGFILPFAWSTLFIFLTLRWFKWSSR